MTTEQWNVGDVKVTLVRESMAPVPVAGLFPGEGRQAVIEANADWLKPHFVDDDGNLRLSIHALVLESQGQTIVIDTCIGDRPVPGYEALAHRGSRWLEAFTEAGFDPARVDLVACTHLHFDHVGWNTMLVDGQWVPTFPNARYLFGRVEYEYWDGGAAGHAVTFGDAVRPVWKAGLADLVEADHKINGELRFEHTPGHSPGHMTVHIESGGEHAVITGDMIHHPAQLVGVDWPMSADDDSPMAGRTRRRFFDEHADTETRIFGTHFAPPTVGYVRRHGDAFSFVV
jgi:glyoxylase-like metal-dependent hydrolase (beta-lactamase superfamily II)